MKILAVDYGASRTGLAVCDPTEFLTTPITPQITLKARPKVAAEVCRIAQEQKAELIVVGLPLNMDGTEGPRAEKCRALAESLHMLGAPEVMLRDERRTSVEAHAILRANGRREKKHRQSVDAVAAQLILETYLGSADNILRQNRNK